MLILSGDHLYRMDYMDFVHVRNWMEFTKCFSTVYTFLDIMIHLLICRTIGRVVQTSPSLLYQWMTGMI